MSMHLRNSRDLMISEEFDQRTFGKLRHVTDTETASRTSSVDTDYGGWWTSKTSLEQKLIVLSSLLFVLSFCLVISVIVINNRKPPKGEVTTVAPITQSVTPASSVPTDRPETTSVEPDSTTAEPTGDSEPTGKSTSPVATDSPSSTDSSGGSSSVGPMAVSPKNEESARTEKKRSLHESNFLGIPMEKRKSLLFGVGV